MSKTLENQESQKNNSLVPIFIIAGLFFIFGFVTWINGALIPFMKTINELTDAQSYLVASASYISFVVMALPASYIIEKVGYKKGMSFGLALMGIGALVFIPAAEARTYTLFLTGIFIQGLGMTLLQTASNPYITILGPMESAAKRIAIMGIANKVAGALGSLIFGAILLSGIDEIKEQLTLVSLEEKTTLLNEMADSVVMPYIIMAVVLFILAVLITKAPLPHVEAEEVEEDDTDGVIVVKKTSIFQFPHLWLGVLALFLYVGVEVIAGDTIISYGLSLGMPGEEAKSFTLMTLFAMVGTYLLGVFLIPKYVSQVTALKVSAILGIVFAICVLSTTGFTSVLFVAALGISNALVWPAIWPLALNGMGKFTKTASALLIMAISGGAIIPPLYGALVDSKKEVLIAQGMEQATATATAATSGYWILIPCYAFILFFAVYGHKIGLKKA
ncbi:sugar MFS transporter [Formosa algae]|jgi:glucose/galactose transporter|uniref:Glucose/galactose transporter n=1 Tax=Formosa algae TaxID=225843 RepID=A0A9X0YLV2_9FLAO|nr:sugar MFS transporter [Formosa algae]MBP1840343.1 glucose/galactose transporter [Formosa algae]MDQ0334207.1 glucose/galactose transporter [Formosa algae]OEI82201.1 glucose/galactose MFS transporter [Formosa algae]